MKFCTNCGNRLDEDVNFCVGCGTRVADTPSTLPGEQAVEQLPEQSQALPGEQTGEQSQEQPQVLPGEPPQAPPSEQPQAPPQQAYAPPPPPPPMAPTKLTPGSNKNLLIILLAIGAIIVIAIIVIGIILVSGSTGRKTAKGDLVTIIDIEEEPDELDELNEPEPRSIDPELFGTFSEIVSEDGYITVSQIEYKEDGTYFQKHEVYYENGNFEMAYGSRGTYEIIKGQIYYRGNWFMIDEDGSEEEIEEVSETYANYTFTGNKIIFTYDDHDAIIIWERGEVSRELLESFFVDSEFNSLIGTWEYTDDGDNYWHSLSISFSETGDYFEIGSYYEYDGDENDYYWISMGYYEIEGDMIIAEVEITEYDYEYELTWEDEYSFRLIFDLNDDFTVLRLSDEDGENIILSRAY